MQTASIAVFSLGHLVVVAGYGVYLLNIAAITWEDAKWGIGDSSNERKTITVAFHFHRKFEFSTIFFLHIVEHLEKHENETRNGHDVEKEEHRRWASESTSQNDTNLKICFFFFFFELFVVVCCWTNNECVRQCEIGIINERACRVCESQSSTKYIWIWNDSNCIWLVHLKKTQCIDRERQFCNRNRTRPGSKTEQQQQRQQPCTMLTN